VRLPFAFALVALSSVACQAREPSGAKVQSEPAPAAVEPRRQLVNLELALVSDEARERLAERLAGAETLAGAEALLAVHHRIDDGWHIYWRNPGETGLRTRLEIVATRLEVGAVLYPGPERFAALGGQVSYGWKHDAVLFVPLRGVGDADATIEVRSRYLACAESCIPGDAELSVSLAQLPVRDDEIIRAMLERLPEPAGDRLSAAWSGNVLTLRPNPEAGEPLQLLEFFPYAIDDAIFDRQQPGDGSLELHYRLGAATPEGAQGVVRASVDGHERWLELAVPWT
jgi:DsbC/DsbD-like thiol-disulfide interchange protein